MSDVKHADFVQKIETVARSWIGTPYRHQCSVKGKGADCLGLVRGIWGELYGQSVSGLYDYDPFWFQHSQEERLLEGLERNLNPIDQIQSGCVLCFRLFAHRPASHLGVVVGFENSFALIHSLPRRGVVEVPFTQSWASRCAAQFSFPSKV